MLSVLDDVRGDIVPDWIALAVYFHELRVWELTLIEVERFALVVFYYFDLVDLDGLLEVLLLLDFEVGVELSLQFPWVEVSGHVLNYDAVVRHVEPSLPTLFDPSDFALEPD